MRRLNFSYGSNLDVVQMQRRCPGAVAVGVATLVDHEIAFTGFSRNRGGAVATVRSRPGSLVPGVVYLLTRRHWQKLDRYEGTPSLYIRRSVDVWIDEHALRVLLYVRATDERERGPTASYLASIRRGYADFGLDPRPLHDAVIRARRYECGEGDGEGLLARGTAYRSDAR